ncbi:similar to An08g00360 [Aspergillus luchuensis]|uniref:Similar to An08g00360 n=1 Tax=Aspergillus kawachii TaxID=1069201 RepID=A0A146G053_ASPKA|nr:similar to An08g00360 [Aspergillus luchuensis]
MSSCQDCDKDIPSVYQPIDQQVRAPALVELCWFGDMSGFPVWYARCIPVTDRPATAGM